MYPASCQRGYACPESGHRSAAIASVIVLTVSLASCAQAPIRSPALGTTQISRRDGMTMVFVPEGEFPMGSTDGLVDEQPVHHVQLDAFWLDQTEVSNEMYAGCVRAGKCEEPSSTTYYADPAFADHPVVYVSWTDAKAYCSWAGRRLPTEAEWEKAAAWDSTIQAKLAYPWGNEFDCRMGNFDDETMLDDFVVPGGPDCDGFVRSAPVGSIPAGASPYGALDMGGNVWEWVHDAFLETDPLSGSVENYYAVSPPSNPQGVDPALTEYRVMRGGSWNLNFGFGRAAYRLWFGLDDAYDFAGFRCANSE